MLFRSQLLSPGSRAQEPQLLSLSASTTEAPAPRACALPRRDSRGERSPWLPLETRPDSPGATGILSPPLVLFIVMLSKAHLTSHSRMSVQSWSLNTMRSFWGIAGKWDSQWVPPGASMNCMNWVRPFLRVQLRSLVGKTCCSGLIKPWRWFLAL